MYKILSYLLTILLFANFAYSQTETAVKQNLVVKQASIPMTRSPSGGKMGEIYINTPVTVEKEEREWVLVTLKAWVKKEGLGSFAASSPAASATRPSDILIIETFSTRIVQEGLPEKRVYLTLKLKNKSNAPIESWKGILVAQANSAVAFREQISDDTKTIPPGQTIELNFYWEPSEPPFQHLQNATPESLKLELYQVVID